MVIRELQYDFTSARDQRTAYMRRMGAMKLERSGYDSHWLDLSRHIMPNNARFFSNERNRGNASRYNRIYDNTGVRANRTLGAGMQAGISNPGRPWFDLVVSDPDLNEYWPVRRWLDYAVERMQRVFQKSNTYRTLHLMYEELGAFGTACSIVRPDPTGVIHHFPVTVGRFYLGTDYKGQVNTLYREFEKTVGEVVKEFGLSACSQAVKDAWAAHELENSVRLVHVIEPRPDQQRDPDSPHPRHMPWKSVYFELDTEDDRLLRESGFQRFPVLAPRWAIAGDDTYGHSPGMESLGDIKQLQHEQLMKGTAISYKVKPPLQVPSTLKDRESEMFPGGISYYEPGMLLPFDQVTPNGGIRAAYEVNLDLADLLNDIVDCRMRINSSHYADLFLMLATMGPDQRMTATEVAERHEEKLIALGPVLERLHNELLQPLIDMTFDIMLEQNLLPPPPPELVGVDIGVEFISILAQAQRAIGSSDIDRFMGNVIALQPVFPTITDKVNVDRWVDIYGRLRGVPSELIIPDEEVARVRQARAAAQAAREQTELMAQHSQTMRNLSETQTANPSALDQVPAGGVEGLPL